MSVDVDEDNQTPLGCQDQDAAGCKKQLDHTQNHTLTERSLQSSGEVRPAQNHSDQKDLDVNLPLSSVLKKTSSSLKSSPVMSDEDVQALEDFCQEVSFDDMSFARFQKVGNDLDLRIPMSLSKEDCDSEGQCHVEYTRTLKRLCGKRVELTRQRVRCKVCYPDKPFVGQEITLLGMGDQDPQGRCGDLVIVLQPKPSSLKGAR
ncbi:MAG: hypothetical protein OXC44_03015 [Proteobacteria bacterium]|nr:hypothetical protein [Pseudomonadota bacterium]